MTNFLSKRNPQRVSIDGDLSDKIFSINRKPGRFFSLHFKSSTFFPRITVERGSDVLTQATCFNSACSTATIDGEKYPDDNLIARVATINGSGGSFKLRLKDHGNLDTITRKVIRLTNRERRREGLDKLSFNSRLQQSAQDHVEDMDRSGRYLGHDSSDGRELRDRIDAVDYDWSYIAENAASGQASPKHAVLPKFRFVNFDNRFTGTRPAGMWPQPNKL